MITNLLLVFAFILLLQIIFFLYAAINKTDKVTDLSYGLTFVITVIGILLLSDNISLYKLLISSVVTVWGLRLSIYLFKRILKIGKDARFDGIRENFKRFLSFWTLQAVSIFIILLPISITLLSPNNSSIKLLTYIGVIIALLGILIEGIADDQKFKFKNDPENRGKWIQSGLWKYSRHPNYLGEIMVWSGLFIACIQALSGLAFISVVSPLYITTLLLFVTGIPTLEKKYDKIYANNKEYIKYKESTGLLLPKGF